MNTSHQELEKYYFNEKSRKSILLQISSNIDQINNKKDYKILVREVRNSYSDIEINDLKKNYEIENGYYKSNNLVKFLALYTAMVALIMSFFSLNKSLLSLSSSSNRLVIWILSIVLFLLIIIGFFYRKARFTKKAKKLYPVIFLLEEVLKIPEPLL